MIKPWHLWMRGASRLLQDAYEDAKAAGFDADAVDIKHAGQILADAIDAVAKRKTKR